MYQKPELDLRTETYLLWQLARQHYGFFSDPRLEVVWIAEELSKFSFDQERLIKRARFKFVSYRFDLPNCYLATDPGPTRITIDSEHFPFEEILTFIEKMPCKDEKSPLISRRFDRYTSPYDFLDYNLDQALTVIKLLKGETQPGGKVFMRWFEEVLPTIEARRQVWESIAKLITSNTRSTQKILWSRDLAYSGAAISEMVQKLEASEFSLNQLRTIYFNEVLPALMWTALSGFDGWIRYDLDKLYVWIIQHKRQPWRTTAHRFWGRRMKSLQLLWQQIEEGYSASRKPFNHL